MKKLLVVFTMIVISIFTSCSKQASNKLAPMNGFEFTTKYHFELSFLDYGHENMIVNRSSKPKPKAETVALTVDEDLIISESVKCTTSPNAEWGGIQKFLAIPLSNDGATSYCNFNWSYSVPDSLMDCPTSISGVYRGWTSDKSTSSTAYNVHLSPLKTIE